MHTTAGTTPPKVLICLSPTSTPKPMKRASYAIRPNEPWDACGAMNTADTKIAAGRVTPNWKTKTGCFCEEHFLYEDECFLCHPELARDQESASGQADSHTEGDSHASGDGLFCNEHGVPEIECGICQPQLAASLKPGGSLKVRLPSTESADLAGIQTDRPRVSDTAPGVKAFCEVQYNLNALAKVTPLAGGVIREVRYDIGDRVDAGDILIELHSAQAASAKSDFLSAIVELDIRGKSLEREKRLVDQNIGTQMDFLEAEAAHRAAQLSLNNLRQKLINLGFNETEIEDIEHSPGYVRNTLGPGTVRWDGWSNGPLSSEKRSR